MKVLLIPSLVFGLFKQFLVLVLAHLLFTPLYNAAHTLTSFVEKVINEK